MSKLFIIDGHSLLYRAFFAVPPLSTKDGTPTNAVYGFLRMMMRLWKEEKPDYLAVALDAPMPTFRHKIFDSYKSQRAKAPELFRPQVLLLKQVLNTLGITFWELEGYEADDLMGTAVVQLKKHYLNNLQVVLVSPDMDALQLVGENVTVFMPKQGISRMEVYDEGRVVKELGISPSLIPDWKGLAGDPSDNLPGVPGVGEKTAANLLQQFGSLESVLRNVEKISLQRVRENIIRFSEQANLCKKLAMISTDAPIELNLNSLSVDRWKLKTKETAQMLMRLEMKSLLKDLGLTELVGEKAVVKGNIVTTDEEWGKILASIKQHGRCALSVGIDNFSGFCVAWENQVAYFSLPKPITATHKVSETTDEVGSLFISPNHCEISASIKDWFLTLVSDPTVVKSAHDWKQILHQVGLIEDINRFGYQPYGFEDTKLLSYMLNPGQSDYSLQHIALENGLTTKFEIEWSSSQLRQDTLSVLTNNPSVVSACEQALTVAELAPILVTEVCEAGMWELLEKVEIPLIFVLAEMEAHGVFIDEGYLRKLNSEMLQDSKKLEEKIYQMAGVKFNIKSPQQLSDVLFNKLKLPMPKRTQSGKPSTAAPVLEALAKKHDIARMILDYRELEKLRSTFVDGLLSVVDKNHRVHTTYNQTGTATGRLASFEPNLQNIPVRGVWGKRIRRAFIPPQGYRLISADYSQIELRILAHLSGDEALMEAFVKGEDIHTQTAANIFGVSPKEVTEDMRRKAKVLNFGIVYGISPFGLAQQLGIDQDEASKLIDRYFERFPKVKEYTHQTIETVNRHKFVRTLMNRRRFLPDIDSPDQKQKEAAQRAAINTPVQGTSADIIKAAMVAIWRTMKTRSYNAEMIMQVHDEIVFEVEEHQVLEIAKLVKRLMESAYKLKVPLIAEVKAGDNWADMERIL